MEKGNAAQEDPIGDHVCDDSEVTGINEENLIANSPADTSSDSSVTPHSNTSELSFTRVNTDYCSPNDSEKKFKSRMLFRSEFSVCADCREVDLSSKSSPQHINTTIHPSSHNLPNGNVDSDDDLSTLGDSNSSQKCIDDLVSRQSKFSPVSHHNFFSCTIDEDSNSALCDDLRNGKEINNIQGNKNVLSSDEHKKNEFDHKEVLESPNRSALATALDEIQREIDEKCSFSAEQSEDKKSTLLVDVDASKFSLKATSTVVSRPPMTANSVNFDSHEGISTTDASISSELTAHSATEASASCLHQQKSFETSLLYATLPGFTSANTLFQNNNDKTKVSFSFPLKSESNFSFGMNNAFSNMPASKNSFQIKEPNTKINKSIFSDKMSIGLFERQDDISRSSPNSQPLRVPVFHTSDNLNTLKINASSIECNVSLPSSKRPLFEISTDCPCESQANTQTPKALNSHTSENTETSKNNGTESFTPFRLNFRVSPKTQSSVAQNGEFLNSKNTSTFSFGSRPSFPGCSKNLFPLTVKNTASLQSTSTSTSDVKNDQTPSFSFGSSFGGSPIIFPAVPVSQSANIFKSPPHNSTSTLKSPIIRPSKLEGIGKTFGSYFFGATSTLNNTQTATTCSELSSSSPLFGKSSNTSLLNTSSPKSFGSLAPFPKIESSRASVSTLFNSKPYTDNSLSKSEPSSNEKPSFTFGYTPKQNDAGQFLLEYKTPLKPSQTETTGVATAELFGANPFYLKTTPSTGVFNFGTSSTAVNFNFGSSLTPNNSAFILNHSDGEKKSSHKPRLRKTINLSQRTNFNNKPEIPKIPFRVVKDKEVCMRNGSEERIELRYQCITTMPEYSSFSFEELRIQYDKYNSDPVSSTETSTILVINEATQTSETMSDNLSDIWKFLECPVCLEIVTSPVLLCEQGHHVCNNCWRKIASCPLCKRRKTQTRNYVAEAMVEKLPLPCKYRVDGCMKTMLQNEKTAHEGKCTFRTYSCLVYDCDKLHNFKDMIVHLKTAHGHLLTSNNGSWNPESWTLTKHNFQKLVHAFDISDWGLFFLRHKISGETNYLWMQVIHSGTSEKGFFYSVEVADKKELRSVSYKGPVFPLHAVINDNQDCLILSENLLGTLKKDYVLHVKISIWKKQP